MPTLFIHIGAHKTGTTALQSAFSSHARHLERFDVMYPRTNWYHFSQHRLAFALKGWKDPVKEDIPVFSAEMRQLNQAIKAAPQSKIFISSEEFFSCPPERISDLAGALQVDQVRILAMVRRPDELALSMYNQNVKQPGNKFARGMRAFVKAPRTLNKDICQYDCIRNWCEVFGTGNVSLLQYESGSTIDQICAYLGIEAGEIKTAGNRVNPSVPGVVVEIMRLSKANGFPRDKQQKLFHTCLEVFRDGRKTYISNQDRREILAHFEADNDRLFAMFGRDNPYRADAVPEEETEEFRQNVTFRDMIRLIDHLMD